MKRIGGFWKHKSKDKGLEYLGGEVEFLAGVKTKLIVFKAKEKKTENSPDYIVYVSDDKQTPAKKPIVKKDDWSDAF